MRLCLRLAAVAALGLALAPAAHAESDFVTTLIMVNSTPADDLSIAWKDFIHSDQHTSIIQKTTSELAHRTFTACKDFKRPDGDAVNVAIYKPVSFVMGKPMAGSWHESFLLNVCGQRVQDNLFFNVPNSSSISVTVGIPGTTVTSGDLQAKALAEFKDAAHVEDAKCTQPVVTNTRYIESSLNTKQRWDEVWTYSGCGGAQDINVHFLADGDHEKVSAGSDKIR